MLGSQIQKILELEGTLGTSKSLIHLFYKVELTCIFECDCLKYLISPFV